MNKDDSQKAGEERDWLNEHGEPDFAYLESLKEEGSVESITKLENIATDLDVDFEPGTTIDELIGKIRLATQENEDGNVNVTD